MAHTVQLLLHNKANNVRKTIETELAQVRNEQDSLPNINDKYNTNSLNTKLVDRMEEHETLFGDKSLPRLRLPRVDQGLMDKYNAARRNTLLAGAMAGHPLVEKLEKQQAQAAKARRKRINSQRPRSQRLSEKQKLAGQTMEAELAAKAAAMTQRSMVRDESRVGRTLAEFGDSKDWVNNVLLKHKLAAILQANWAGYKVRKKWKLDPTLVVDEIKRKMEEEKEAEAAAEAAAKAAEAKLQKQRELLQRTVHLFQVKTAAGSGPGSRWKAALGAAALDSDASAHDSDSASDLSDLEIDDVAAVKFRARTPPWQRMEDSAWNGQYAKLQQKMSRGKLDVQWDLDCSMNRVEQVKARRQGRDPNRPSSRANGTAGGSRVGSAMAGARASSAKPSNPVPETPYDPNAPLPADIVNDMLLERYIQKYERLGLTKRAPLQSVKLTTDITKPPMYLLMDEDKDKDKDKDKKL